MNRIENAAFAQRVVVNAVQGTALVKGKLVPGKWVITLDCGHENIFATHPGACSFCRTCIDQYLNEKKLTAHSVA